MSVALSSADWPHWLLELLQTPGISGAEAPVRAWLQARWASWADELMTTPLGSLVARLHGTGPEPRPRVLLAAHMDTIGFVVAQVDEAGWLALAPVGGLDARLLPNQAVYIWPAGTDEPIYGVLRAWPRAWVPDLAPERPLPLDALRVETGLSARRLRQQVVPGTPVTFARAPVIVHEAFVIGPGLDNRASVAALTWALLELAQRQHAWDVDIVATVQEETTMAGAATAAYRLEPTVAVAVDVTFGRGPGVAEHQGFPLGGGVPIGVGANMHPKVSAALIAAAQEAEIPHHIEYLPAYSGTDAAALQVARAGIPTGLVSIPLRYMHTPVEMVALDDIRRAGRLLATWIAGLDPEFTDHLTLWDEEEGRDAAIPASSPRSGQGL